MLFSFGTFIAAVAKVAAEATKFFVEKKAFLIAGTGFVAGARGVISKYKEYKGEEVDEKISMDGQLNDLRKKYYPEIDENEKKAIDKIKKTFSRLTDTVKYDYPEMAERIESKKTALLEELQGTYRRELDLRISTNNQDFVGLLKMAPSNEKDSKIQDKVAEMISNIDEIFDSKRKESISEICREISNRFNAELDKADSILQEKERLLRETEGEAEAAETVIGLHRDELLFYENAAAVLEQTFQRMYTIRPAGSSKVS